ncbi:MAG: sigma 54-interacting transcriptional regulator [Natronospirillum sp.]|uniref:sigma-54 interaction domain-containing protein n=1 Tax=Natronospirillum sp. TaxID=2812955 RepID=UPI0025F4B9F7|nr:sigma 54-interacting transcriptional regulator [Natronospirillum sp.]MCH8552768.1 sigma 54-interacting transcriptional regulator [Natronospirillum sp.]
MTSSTPPDQEQPRLWQLPQAATLVAAFDAIEEWIVIVDAESRVVFMNRPYARFLGLRRRDIIGRPVTEVIENTRMHKAVQTGKAERIQLQEIKGNKMIANRYPIIVEGGIKGAVGTVFFHDTHEWQQINTQIRALIAEQNYQTSDHTSPTREGARFHLADIIGRSPAIEALNERVKRVAASDVSVLIRGESGTGKELYAHALHQLSERSDGPFIKVNCAAIPENLLEAELFGYEGGAFTGARKGGKPGKFQLANRGTLFLDEIGDMPLAMQAKLLRVLQDRQVEAVGSTSLVPVDIRMIAATHQPLEQLVESGQFRQDLYYRIHVVGLTLPPLRERRDDIPMLVEHQLQQLSRRTGRRAPRLTAEALTRLMHYDWPGNIRELHNVLEATFHLSQGRKIGLEALPEPISGAPAIEPQGAPMQQTLKDQLHQAEYDILCQALRTCGNNRQQTARHLGISKSTLYEKLARHGL